MEKRSQKEYEILFDGIAHHLIPTCISKGSLHYIGYFGGKQPEMGQILKDPLKRYYRITDNPTKCDIYLCMGIKKINI